MKWRWCIGMAATVVGVVLTVFGPGLGSGLTARAQNGDLTVTLDKSAVTATTGDSLTFNSEIANNGSTESPPTSPFFVRSSPIQWRPTETSTPGSWMSTARSSSLRPPLPRRRGGPVALRGRPIAPAR